MNGHAVDLSRWERAELFALFREFTEPFHGICIRLDCTEAFEGAKRRRESFFLSLLHASLVSAHRVENFRTRIVEGVPWQYDRIDGGSAVGRPNGTIGFAHYPFHDDAAAFIEAGAREIERVKSRTDLQRYPGQDLIRFSMLPWLDFTSISHARHYGFEDSAPRITFGKVTETDGKRSLPVSIHVHHALVDGAHVAEFVEQLQGEIHSDRN